VRRGGTTPVSLSPLGVPRTRPLTPPERTRVRGGNSSLSLSLSVYLVGDARLIYADRTSYLFYIIRRGPIQGASKESDRYLGGAARAESDC
jgi:hypothetical protein